MIRNARAGVVTAKDWRAKLFVAVGAASAALPRVKGKARAVLALYRALGLARRRIYVDAGLRFPTHYRARLDLGSWLERLAFVTGGYEDDTATFLVNLQRAEGRGGYVLDIGANVGLITIPTALLMRRVSAERCPLVVAIEPVPANAESLRANVALNCLQRECPVVECGVGDSERTVEIEVDADAGTGRGTGTANVIAEGANYDCQRIPLRLSTLDALVSFQALPPGCAVVKIDTDGYDLKAMQGGEQFLHRDRPVIFGEFSAHCLSWHGQSLDSIEAFFAGLDYSVLARIPGSWRFTPDLDATKYEQDILLIPREKADHFHWCLSPR